MNYFVSLGIFMCIRTQDAEQWRMDPDLQIRGGPALPKNFFPLFGPHFGQKIRGPLPWIRHCRDNKITACAADVHVFLQLFIPRFKWHLFETNKCSKKDYTKHCMGSVLYQKTVWPVTSTLYILINPELTFSHAATELIPHSILECSAKGPLFI